MNKPATTTRRSTSGTAKPSKKYDGVILARVYDKETGAVLGYAAKPSKPLDEQGNVKPWHRVVCDEQTGEWSCDCDGNAVWHRRCKHIKAACELSEIRAKQPAQEEPQATTNDSEVSQVEVNVIDISMPGDVRGWRPVQRRLPDGEWYPMGIYSDGKPIEFTELALAQRFIAASTDEQRREVIIAAKRAEKKETLAPKPPLPRVTAERGPVSTRLTEKPDMLNAPLNGNRGFSKWR